MTPEEVVEIPVSALARMLRYAIGCGAMTLTGAALLLDVPISQVETWLAEK